MKKSIRSQTAPIDFDLRQLETFRKVVELKSFSKAAVEVFLAQASVSERISNLETMVGAKLLDRLGREVVPTRAGQLLYKHAVRLLEMKRTVSQELRDFLGMRQGEIHIGGSTIPGEYILPHIIGRFNKDYPLVSVTLTVADTSEIEGRILHGDFDLGVVGSKGRHRRLIYHELWNDEMVLAVSASHPWAKKSEVTIEELCKEPFILREVGSGTRRSIEDQLQASVSKGIDSFHVIARFGTSTAVKEGVKAGLGVSILSSKALDTELKTGILKTLLVKDLSMSRTFYLIRDRRRTVSPMCRAMLDFLIATSKEDEPGILA